MAVTTKFSTSKASVDGRTFRVQTFNETLLGERFDLSAPGKDASFGALFNIDPTYSKMTAMSRRALVAAAILGATLCFSLGWLASRFADSSKREPTSTPPREPVSSNDHNAHEVDEGKVPEPTILIDPSKVLLLPDASLNFDPPKPLEVPGQP